MEVFGIGVLALCAVLFAALVQKSNKEYGILISLGASVVLLLLILDRAGPVFNQIEDMTGQGALEGEAIELMLKAVGITVVGQVVSRLCKDAGESALSYTVELAARAAVLAAALPAVGKILEYLGEIATM